MKYNKIYLKITTIPNQMDVDLDSEEIKIFRNKYEAHKGFLKDSDVELDYLNESAVNGSFAKVYSITLGFVYEGVPIVKTLFGKEEDLLDKLLTVLRQDEFSNATVVMYNRTFILSFLSKRIRFLNYPISMLPKSLYSFGLKEWNLKQSKCIQSFVKGTSYQTENFSETCFIHGVDSDVIEGSDVSRYIKKEQFGLVHQSDISYVFALMQIDQQLSEEPKLNKVTSIIEEIGKVKKQEINVLDHIVASGHISSTIVEAIVKFTEENGLNKENVLTLVKTALSKQKPYQKVEEEDYQELKTALGLDKDYSLIKQVSEKGNMGAKECKVLIKEYKDKPIEDKKQIVKIVTEFLTEKGKINQKRTGEALTLLKSSLLI